VSKKGKPELKSKFVSL